MKPKTYIKFFSVVVAIMVLFSSIGLTINAHYCHTTGEIKKSILPLALYCEHEDGSASCALPPATEQADSCCSTEPITHEAADDQCCEDYKTFLKLLSEFDLSTIKAGFNLFLQFVIGAIELIKPSISDATVSQSKYHDPPPLIYGKQLLLAFKQLKLAPSTL